MSSGKRRILVCGGGNGAHCIAALESSRDNVEVNVLTLYKDEAERWNKALTNSDMRLTVVQEEGDHHEIHSKPNLITNDPEKAMSDLDIIFIVVPAFTHELYLKALAPHLHPNTVIVGLPGQAGFEFQCRSILGDKASTCTIVSLESLPWVCRIEEFGKHIEMLGTKKSLGISYIAGKSCKLTFPVIETIQNILGEKPVLEEMQNYIATNLLAKSIIHPPLMYGKWSEWDGKPFKEIPLFYQGVDERQADFLSKVSYELVATGKKYEKLQKNIDMSQVMHIHKLYLTKMYDPDQIGDNTSLMTTMRTNKAFDGLLHPMIKTEEGYVPNFNSRFLCEDIPYGLVVMKGIAEIAEVDTPFMDEIITWAQKKLGKEYIVGNKLTGKDLGSARAPQSYGIRTVKDLFEM